MPKKLSSKTYYLLFCSVFIMVMFLTTMVWFDPLTHYLKKTKSDRKILSTLYFHYPDVLEHGFQVIKYKLNEKVYVDVYKIFSDNSFELLTQFDTKTKFDGYFLLGSNATNLAFVDIDEDSRQDIIIPGFDKNLVAYLNVLKYDIQSKSFSIVNEIVDLIPNK